MFQILSKEEFDKINVQVLVCIDRGLEHQHQQTPPPPRKMKIKLLFTFMQSVD